MIDRVGQETDMMSRHLEVMRLVKKHAPIGMVKMADETAHAQHEIRYSLRVLENESLIEPTPHGAITTERTDEYADELNNQIDNLIDKFERIRVEQSPELNP